MARNNEVVFSIQCVSDDVKIGLSAVVAGLGWLAYSLRRKYRIL